MRIFAADIGGTNSRFGLFEGSSAEALRCAGRCTLPSAAADFAEQLKRLAEVCPDCAPDKADVAVLAVAGPVLNQEKVQLTNLSYAVNAADLRLFNSALKVRFINDFKAQALACMTPLSRDFLPLTGQGGNFDFSAKSAAPCAVIGAGTGLGTALLLADGEKIRVLPTEYGHTSFAFSSAEQDFAAFAGQKRGGSVQSEHLLSGAGLSLIHEYCTGKRLYPAEITAEPSFSSSATCEFFALFFARACRQLALTCLPSDIVISGGLAQHSPALIRHPVFISEFLNIPAAFHTLLSSVRIWHNPAPDAGLRGAARAAFSL